MGHIWSEHEFNFVSANKMNQNVATNSLIYSKVSHHGLQYIYLKGGTTEPETGQ